VLVLAIDTSSAAVTAALADVGVGDGEGVTVRAEHVTVNARGHGEHLAPNIAACLADCAATPGNLAAIVAGTGPGPFTGLRVGLVTAAVLAETLRIPAYGVCSLDAIGPDDGALLVAADARRKEVYWARYAGGVRVDGPHVSRPADVPLDGVTHTAGAGARLYQDVFGIAPLEQDFPSAAALVARAADRIRAHAPSEPLTPLYLRRPDAVEPGAPKQVLP
jgi:tRNA threonylcarbamoyl adenosine modification protein YeaZ